MVCFSYYRYAHEQPQRYVDSHVFSSITKGSLDKVRTDRRTQLSVQWRHFIFISFEKILSYKIQSSVFGSLVRYCVLCLDGFMGGFWIKCNGANSFCLSLIIVALCWCCLDGSLSIRLTKSNLLKTQVICIHSA